MRPGGWDSVQEAFRKTEISFVTELALSSVFLRQFSIYCRKTRTKVITTSNHNKGLNHH